MGKNIGYANVPVELSKLGTKLEVMVEGTDERPATVVRKPFVDPDKDIPKS
jgi:aminomethyltransferase